MDGVDLELVLALDSASASTLWRAIQAGGLVLPGTDSRCRVADRSLPVAAVWEHLRETQAAHFRIRADGYIFDLTPVRNHAHCLLQVHPTVVRDQPWDQVVLAVAEVAGLISARVFDVEFEYWQNAQDPLEYRAKGRSLRGLRIARDPVFGDQLIDISQNPGRRLLRNGYVEAIGPIMWFGPAFWVRTGARRGEVIAASFLRHCSLSEILDRIEIPGGPLTSTDESRQLQENVRGLLFPDQGGS